ncbi:MAG: signal peptidase I [Chloroflexota bacterium]|nr:signal peptidase I [Chloroflexota bacterium]
MRRTGHWLGLAALVVLGVAWGMTVRPAVLGGPATYIVVRGDSMVPTYATGDLVILAHAETYSPREIVGYRVPAGELGAGLVVVHRIIGGDAASGFILQGDNNPAPDPWLPHRADIVGRAVAQVPTVGRLVTAVRQPAVLAALGAAVAVTFVLLPPTGGRKRSPRARLSS